MLSLSLGEASFLFASGRQREHEARAASSFAEVDDACFRVPFLHAGGRPENKEARSHGGRPRLLSGAGKKKQNVILCGEIEKDGNLMQG